MKIEDLTREELIDLLKTIESKKKYGLVWETEKVIENFLVKTRPFFPILKEDVAKCVINATNDNPHILIEGENLHALQILNYTHNSKVDLIYIDPPYNTGKDFIYNDQYVDDEDTFRHSKWLSFMSKRLELCKDLLAPNGFIFISIDDHEYAQLKILCDEIFGGIQDKNYVGTFVWQRAKGGGNSKKIVRGHEYILVYCNGTDQLLTQEGNKTSEHLRKFNDPKFKDKYMVRDGIVYFINDDTIRRVFGKYEKGTERRCEYENLLKFKSQKVKDEIDNLISIGEYILVKQKSGLHYICKLEPVAGMRQAMYSLIQGHLTEVGKNDLINLGMDLSFDYPKPVSLMKLLLDSINKKDALILDFFAGSGTTAQAVMELNDSDDGKRQAILVTNNEANICTEVTYPRLEKVLRGYKTPTGEIKGPLKDSLMYFKIEYIPKTSNSDEMLVSLSEEVADAIRVKEGVFEEIQTESINFRIFKNKKRILGIYHALDYSELDNMRNLLELSEQDVKSAYVFTFDNFGLNKNDFIGWDNISLEALPFKIFEIVSKYNA